MTLKKYFAEKKNTPAILIRGFLALLFVFAVVFFIWSIMQYNEIMEEKAEDESEEEEAEEPAQEAPEEATEETDAEA